MSYRAYLVISGTIFGIVAIVHVFRVINNWTVVIGPWTVSIWVSWLGMVVPAFLCVWAFRLASRMRT